MENEKVLGADLKQQGSVFTPEMNKNKAQSIEFKFQKIESDDDLILKKV